jgi:hypothetical protein
LITPLRPWTRATSASPGRSSRRSVMSLPFFFSLLLLILLSPPPGSPLSSGTLPPPQHRLYMTLMRDDDKCLEFFSCFLASLDLFHDSINLERGSVFWVLQVHTLTQSLTQQTVYDPDCTLLPMCFFLRFRSMYRPMCYLLVQSLSSPYRNITILDTHPSDMVILTSPTAYTHQQNPGLISIHLTQICIPNAPTPNQSQGQRKKRKSPRTIDRQLACSYLPFPSHPT